MQFTNEGCGEKWWKINQVKMDVLAVKKQTKIRRKVKLIQDFVLTYSKDKHKLCLIEWGRQYQ